MSTLSFIFAMPKRVMPSTSPLYVMTSASSMLKARTRTLRKNAASARVSPPRTHLWRTSMLMPCACMVALISWMMRLRAASIPSVRSASITWLVVVAVALTPSVPITACRFVPSTSRLYRPPPRSLITARSTDGMPCTMTFCSAMLIVCSRNTCFMRSASGGVT